jgi:hypothetical protein
MLLRLISIVLHSHPFSDEQEDFLTKLIGNNQLAIHVVHSLLKIQKKESSDPTVEECLLYVGNMILNHEDAPSDAVIALLNFEPFVKNMILPPPNPQRLIELCVTHNLGADLTRGIRRLVEWAIEYLHSNPARSWSVSTKLSASDPEWLISFLLSNDRKCEIGVKWNKEYATKQAQSLDKTFGELIHCSVAPGKEPRAYVLRITKRDLGAIDAKITQSYIEYFQNCLKDTTTAPPAKRAKLN